MNPNLQNLIELQALDDVIRGLDAEVAALPRTIAQIESTLATHIRQVESDKHALVENQKSRRKREGEIAALRDKISHYKDQSLQVKTNDQYKALLHEVEFQEKEIGRIEEQILAEMIESESLEKMVREAEQKLSEERRRAEGEIAAARGRQREDEEKLAEVRSTRQTIRSSIALDVYETYERIARGRKGLAVAPVHDVTCGACHVHLRPQVLSELMLNERVHTCESCGRILYYAPQPVATENAG